MGTRGGEKTPFQTQVSFSNFIWVWGNQVRVLEICTGRALPHWVPLPATSTSQYVPEKLMQSSPYLLDCSGRHQAAIDTSASCTKGIWFTLRRKRGMCKCEEPKRFSMSCHFTCTAAWSLHCREPAPQQAGQQEFLRLGGTLHSPVTSRAVVGRILASIFQTFYS